MDHITQPGGAQAAFEKASQEVLQAEADIEMWMDHMASLDYIDFGPDPAGAEERDAARVEAELELEDARFREVQARAHMEYYHERMDDYGPQDPQDVAAEDRAEDDPELRAAAAASCEWPGEDSDSECSSVGTSRSNSCGLPSEVDQDDLLADECAAEETEEADHGAGFMEEDEDDGEGAPRWVGRPCCSVCVP